MLKLVTKSSAIKFQLRPFSTTTTLPTAGKKLSEEDQQFLFEVTLKIENQTLTLQEHIQYLRQPLILAHDKYCIMILNSMFKKLVSNEGITKYDDLHRPTNEQTLNKIRSILKQNKDVKNMIASMNERMHDFRQNYLVSYLTFLQKADMLDRVTLLSSIAQFKKNLQSTSYIADPSKEPEVY